MCSTAQIFNFFVFVAAAIPVNLACDGRRVMERGVGDYHKSVILEMHNKLRQVVALGQISDQPPASNMAEMTWNDKLARRAQYWAETCSSITHDPGRHFPEYYVGQNIAAKWTTRRPTQYNDVESEWYEDAISKWFDEYENFNFGGGATGKVTGHYTQMVWAGSKTIGCGYVAYSDPSKKLHKRYVCNYGPSGNVRGELPYKRGYPDCYAHGMVPSTIYQGLCDNSLRQTILSNDYFYDYYYKK